MHIRRGPSGQAFKEKQCAAGLLIPCFCLRENAFLTISGPARVIIGASQDDAYLFFEQLPNEVLACSSCTVLTQYLLYSIQSAPKLS